MVRKGLVLRRDMENMSGYTTSWCNSCVHKATCKLPARTTGLAAHCPHYEPGEQLQHIITDDEFCKMNNRTKHGLD